MLMLLYFDLFDLLSNDLFWIDLKVICFDFYDGESSPLWAACGRDSGDLFLLDIWDIGTFIIPPDVEYWLFYTL